MSEQNGFAGGGFEPQGRVVAPGRGVEWLREGWRLFLASPGVWVAMALILMVLFLVLGAVPVVGQLAANLVTPVFAGGMLLGCRVLDQGGTLRVDHLFAGFRLDSGNLILVGVYYTVALVVVALAAVVVGGGAALGVDMLGHGSALGGLLLALLLMLLLTVPLMMAAWFAPALVVLRDLPPVDAMKASFVACARNVIPFLLYGLVLTVLLLVALLPLGLGLLVLLPLIVCSVYRAYLDIFE